MKYELEVDGSTHPITLNKNADGSGWQVTLDGKEFAADICWIQPDVLSLLIAGQSYRILYDPRGDGPAVALGARRVPYTVVDPRSLGSRSRTGGPQAGARSVTAPMPGRIVRILVQVGESVAAHQGLLVMEAMKMQNELKSPSSGTVKRIAVGPDETVQPGQALVVIE